MFDPFTMALIGGGLGALTSKKPLKGAAMGAAMGGAGGLLAGAGGASGGMGGLLGNPMTAASYGTGLDRNRPRCSRLKRLAWASCPRATDFWRV